jgi:hypothetical protein
MEFVGRLNVCHEGRCYQEWAKNLALVHYYGVIAGAT